MNAREESKIMAGEVETPCATCGMGTVYGIQPGGQLKCPDCGGSGIAPGAVETPEAAVEAMACAYVEEGWWHPNVKSGQVHDHPERPGGSWSVASHRLCEPVYTKRHAQGWTPPGGTE